ncbi:energy transducer TonB [Deferrisoma palaeochoriense]
MAGGPGGNEARLPAAPVPVRVVFLDAAPGGGADDSARPGTGEGTGPTPRKIVRRAPSAARPAADKAPGRRSSLVLHRRSPAPPIPEPARRGAKTPVRPAKPEPAAKAVPEPPPSKPLPAAEPQGKAPPPRPTAPAGDPAPEPQRPVAVSRPADPPEPGGAPAPRAIEGVRAETVRAIRTPEVPRLRGDAPGAVSGEGSPWSPGDSAHGSAASPAPAGTEADALSPPGQGAGAGGGPTTAGETKGAGTGVEDREAQPDYAAISPPPYPRLARRRGWQGVVRLRVRVSSRGEVIGASVDQSSGYRVLDQAALEAVQGWRFTPAVREGHPVESVVVVPVRFALNPSR